MSAGDLGPLKYGALERLLNDLQSGDKRMPVGTAIRIAEISFVESTITVEEYDTIVSKLVTLDAEIKS